MIYKNKIKIPDSGRQILNPKSYILNSRGSLTIEALIATAVVTLVLVVSALGASTALSASRRALSNSQAAFLLEEGAEIVKVIRDNSWASVAAYSTSSTYYASWSGGTWVLNTTASSLDGFTRTFDFDPVSRDANDDIASSGTNDAGTRKVTVTVSWQSGSGATISKTLVFYVADILS